MPILGFLGTVLGITEAIGGINPEQMNNDPGAISNGLTKAFDATALALSLTLVSMFPQLSRREARTGAARTARSLQLDRCGTGPSLSASAGRSNRRHRHDDAGDATAHGETDRPVVGDDGEGGTALAANGAATARKAGRRVDASNGCSPDTAFGQRIVETEKKLLESRKQIDAGKPDARLPARSRRK